MSGPAPRSCALRRAGREQGCFDIICTPCQEAWNDAVRTAPRDRADVLADELEADALAHVVQVYGDGSRLTSPRGFRLHEAAVTIRALRARVLELEGRG